MNDKVSVPRPVLEALHSRISYLENVVRKVAERVHIPEEELEPPAGSNAWWIWAESQADEDIKAGRVRVFSTAKDLEEYLTSL